MKSNYKNNQSSDGFTLIELLVAASITTIVVSIAGSGLVSIMQNNSRAEAETLRRVQLNRALDFMSDEVRTAKTIAKDASTNLATVAPGFNPSGKTPVLTLEISGVSQRVIYYTGTPSTTSVWFDPKAPDAKMIYRWGPTFGDDGQYTNADNDPPVGCSSFTTCNPSSWDGNALVDLIADTTPTSATTCPGLTGWTANPSVNNGQGFTACVDPTGKIAKINLRGKLTDAYNNSRPPFEISTKTFARPYTPTFTTGSGGGSGLGGSGGTGTVTFTQPSTAYFEVLGGSMDCPGKGEIPTTTTIKTIDQAGNTTTKSMPSSGTKALNLSADVGTKLTITGFADNSWCSSWFPDHTFNSETDKDTQVWTLRNGDTPPPFAPYGKQPKIDTFLTKYLDANKKIKLAENQVIYLFELFTTTKTDDTYDMQDVIVLATITPKEQ